MVKMLSLAKTTKCGQGKGHIEKNEKIKKLHYFYI